MGDAAEDLREQEEDAELHRAELGYITLCPFCKKEPLGAYRGPWSTDVWIEDCKCGRAGEEIRKELEKRREN